jgi:hypothetical protein
MELHFPERESGRPLIFGRIEMRKCLIAALCSLIGVIGGSVVFAQKTAEDSGWVDIGMTRETATQKRPVASIYKGSGVTIYAGKPPKPWLQHDMSAYELDPAPASDRGKSYNRRDFSGVWEKLPVSAFERIPPMTPLGWQMISERVPGSGPRGHLINTKRQNDPQLMCDPIGWPYIILRSARPVEMIHIPGRMLQHYAWHETWRTIWLDGRLLPRTPSPTWVGYSAGKWVGDTLIADTVGVDQRAWIDEMGSPHSDNAEMQERWRRIDHNTLQFNLTIKDPEVYVDKWEGEPLIFQLYPNLEVDHTPCVPSEEISYIENSPSVNIDVGKK